MFVRQVIDDVVGTTVHDEPQPPRTLGDQRTSLHVLVVSKKVAETWMRGPNEEGHKAA